MARTRMNPRHRLVLGMTLAALTASTLAGCGPKHSKDADSGSDAESTASGTVGSDAEGDDAPSADGPFAHTPLQYTNGDGWTYRFTPSWGDVPATVTKTVESAPPGEAAWHAEIDTSALAWDYIGDTPGRTPPTPRGLEVWVVWSNTSKVGCEDGCGYIGYGSSIPGVTANHSDGCGTATGALTDSLVLSKADNAALTNLVGVNGLACRVSDDDTGAPLQNAFSSLSDEAEESQLDQWLAAMGDEVSIAVTFPACVAIYSPDGQVRTVSERPDTPGGDPCSVKIVS